ncbi:MAG: glycosyltransferase family 1 protein [Anaerolineales bacterium]
MPASPTHVALNAQLLAGQASYRSAGIHHYIDRLLRHLPQAGPDLRLTIFTGAGQPDVPGAALRRTRLPTGRPIVRIIWEQVLQPLALARLRPDLLHSLAFVSPILAAPPTVVTVYDLSFKLMPHRFRPAQRLYLNALTAHSCRRARRVIAISESTRADLQRHFGLARERIDVAYPGVEPAFRPLPATEVEAFRARRGLPARFVLYLGTLEPRKNLASLVEAFAALRPAQPGLCLVLAGARGWWYQDLLRQVESLGLAEAVVFPGYVPEAELPLWYNAAAAFAYPSSYEGFGIPVVEALACGRPVVTTTAASLPEAAGEAALLVPPGDAPALAAALERALRLTPDELARGPAHAARFTWAATAAQTAASYRRALHLAPSAAPAAAPRQVQGS